MGGHMKNPSYKDICTGQTGHAEVARIVYDPAVISLDEILEVFWMTHDPTTLNRQGADVGTQYRSAVFYANEDQRTLAQRYKEELDKSGAFSAPIVTELSPISVFYEAEDYHQNYYALNGEQGYCRMVIRPKLDKFRKVFADRLRDGTE
jgi:peptide-methionine (S)-S-oxide reductase